MSKAKMRPTRKRRHLYKQGEAAKRAHRKIGGRSGSILAKRRPSAKAHHYRRDFPAPPIPDCNLG